MKIGSSPRVTILMSARERFSATREVLNAVYEHTRYPFRLVYVDGGAPRGVRGYLQHKAESEGFELIRFPHYLWPNRARNIALSRADTEYVVFLDNDTLVSPGWLERLVSCADETGADVVTPLVCQYRPVHSEIHYAGGETGIAVQARGEQTARRLVDRMRYEGQPIERVRPHLERAPTGLFEFHCVLMRRSVFERIGPMDERVLNTREHVDYCLRLRAAGGSVYLEPDAVVTYLGATPLLLSDMPFYMLRWSDAWTRASVARLEQKWSISGDDYLPGCMRHMAWRRNAHVIAPLARMLTRPFGGRGRGRVTRLLSRLDRLLNPRLSARYARQVGLTAGTPVHDRTEVSLDAPGLLALTEGLSALRAEREREPRPGGAAAAQQTPEAAAVCPVPGEAALR